ncbi:MAG: hypothetical protein N4A40_12620 [Tissierellales bacterium]|jgi:hypothetical protein|nr:hypothetical protein [Tissierellales bacterium]
MNDVMYRVTQEDILNKLIYFSFSKDEVVNKDYERINDVIETFKKAKIMGKNNLMLAFEGYEEDIKDIYEIEEIREYIHKLIDIHPYLFYFLSDIDNNNGLILACISSFEIKEPRIGIQLTFNKELIGKITRDTFEYGKLINEYPGTILKLLTDLIGLVNGPNTISEDVAIDCIRLAIKNKYKDLYRMYISRENYIHVPEEEVKDVIKNNEMFIRSVYRHGYLSVPIIFTSEFTNFSEDDPEKFYSNLFIIVDRMGNKICPECGGNIAVVHKKTIEFKESLWKNINILPTSEFYFENNIKFTDSFFLNQVPVPINIEEDTWYCPNCLEKKNFTISCSDNLIFAD